MLCVSCIDEYFQPTVPRCIGCMKQQESFAVCKRCKTWLPLCNVYYCGTYDGVQEALIKELKFNYKRQAVVPIAEMITKLPIQNETDVVLCPLPTAPSRIRERGFDHTKLITGQLAKKSNINSQNILKRHSNTRQLGSSRKKRTEQMKEEFYISNTKIPESVMLIDDVFTTGSTLAAAAETLKASGVKRVSAIIFARKI